MLCIKQDVWCKGCCCIKIMEEKTITMQDLWLLLRPSKAFDTRGRYEKCLADWSSMNEAQQKRVFKLLQDKKEHAGLNPNPYYALNDAMQEDEQQQVRKAKPQMLTFNDYYARYGTTEERDGWKMANPTGQQVIYVKAG